MSAREIHVVLSELEQVLVESGITSLGLRPPASDSAIKEFEDTTGVALPADYRAFLKMGDGQEAPSSIALLPGGHFGRLEALAECWRHEKGESDEGYEEEAACGDDDPIRFLRYHPSRVPIGGSPWLDGDNTYLDLTPGPAGQLGQVIGLVTECDFIVLGLSITDYLERVLALLRSGQIEVLKTEPGPRFMKANKENPWERWDGLLMSR